MTQEEKAKAYDEALKLAREKRDIALRNGADITVKFLEEIFTELRESEDERIRKALVWHLKASEDFVSNGVTKAECLAYLEKQKEKEQKPAWSEEDEKELDCIINVLDRLGFEEFCKSSRDQDIEEERFYYKEIQFLKRLKSLRPQPKREWSKEDERMIDTIASVLGQYIDYKSVSGTGSGYAIPRYGKEIDWLKSLRPCPSWKPSEHQMNILKAVKEYVGRGSGYWGEGLGSLIEDLEKLI